MHLSAGQQKACEFITDFLTNKNEPHNISVPRFPGDSDPLVFTSNQIMVLSGGAGTGKTTVIKYALEHLENVRKTMRAVGIEPGPSINTKFTATTNKAAEAFEMAMGGTVTTIHSLLKLSMQENPETLMDELVSYRPDELIYGTVVFIDEASYIDIQMLEHIYMKLGSGTKIIFIGDKAQCKTAAGDLPVFEEGRFPIVELTEIMRQEGEDNPIRKLSERLRKWVLEGGPTPPCEIDNKYIVWLPREKFEQIIVRDMCRSEWSYTTSKVLTFTNKRVNHINKLVYESITGSHVLRAKDYAICNSYVAGKKNILPSIGTDRMVYLDSLEPGEMFKEAGHFVWTDRNKKGSKSPDSGEQIIAYFMPHDKKAKDKALKKLSKQLQSIDAGDPMWTEVRRHFDAIKNTWIDLRPVYGCTVHKAQGSTFTRVYVDLADISNCYDKDQMRRLLYVACSRARSQLVLTGDIP